MACSSKPWYWGICAALSKSEGLVVVSRGLYWAIDSISPVSATTTVIERNCSSRFIKCSFEALAADLMSAGLMVWVRREARHVVSQQELYRATTGPDQSQYPIGRSGWLARRSDRRKQRGMVNSVTHRSLTGK